MSQLDLLKGGPLPVPRESATVFMLLIFGIMQILVACNIATSKPVEMTVSIFAPMSHFIKGPHRADCLQL
jgi:hypothetical protein